MKQNCKVNKDNTTIPTKCFVSRRHLSRKSGTLVDWLVEQKNEKEINKSDMPEQ